MNFKKFEGVFPALVTPFDKDGKVKVDGLRQVVQYLITKQKVDGLYVTGSTGEFLLLSFAERKEVLEVVAQEAKGKITLIAQVGGLNVLEVKELAKVAEKAGYDAISAITPYYYRFSFEEVKGYYEAIAQATNLPMLIYYLPQLAGSQMGTEQFGELLKIKNVIGCKYGATDVYVFERLLSKYPNNLFMYAWDEALSVGLMLGAKGFIGSTYNINAEGVRRIIAAYNKNDQVALRREMHTYNDFIETALSTGLMQLLKAVLNLEGVDAGYNRLPFKFIEKEKLEAAAKMIKEKYLK